MSPDAPTPTIFTEITPDRMTLPIHRSEVSRLAGCGPDPRWDDVVLRAVAEARSLIEPRARFAAIPRGATGLFFDGPTPVAAIAERGEAWGFAATIGDALETRVREHFEASRYLEGVLLDAAGSTAVEAVGDVVERTCAGSAHSARFSPGYCAWPLSSQRQLFKRLRPEAIGVRLLPSCLMQPLKSITGIVVRAPAADLLVPVEVCETCDARGCTRRRLL